MEEIHDHGVIGNCRSAALVSRRGTIDWLCWPRFDSPSIFGALLDDRAGHWSLHPTAPFSSRQRYVPGTNVLETRFRTAGGSVVVTDFMPAVSEEEKHELLLAEHEILRLVRCEGGEVEIESVLRPRPGYAQGAFRIRDAGKLGVRIHTDQGLMIARGSVPLAIVDGEEIRGRKLLREGDELYFSLVFAADAPAVLAPGESCRKLYEHTLRFWRGWVSKLRYHGPMREAVERSALALELLVYAPSGAVVAAPTTSLPERVGGDLNWDYRYCWLRDASLTVRALFGLGFDDEAEAFVSWLLHSTRLTQPRLRVLYDVYGNAPARERELDHLGGYFGSRPVRVGNAADEQLQLDVHGEVVDAVAHFVRRGGRLDLETERMLVSFGDYVCRRWTEPDEGIWEPRSGRRHHTHSLVLCWVALDNLLRLHDQGHLAGIPVERFARTRDRIRREVETRAWNPHLRAYVSELEGETVDASALLIAWYGFEPPDSERMRLTYARIREELGAGGGLLYRYRSADSPGEAAFGICSFWGAEYLALGGGSVEEAQDLLETLCGYANEVGLFGEEIDPVRRVAAGNFPQAFTHVGLVNAALTLSHRLRGRTPHHRGIPAADSEGGAAS